MPKKLKSELDPATVGTTLDTAPAGALEVDVSDPASVSTSSKSKRQPLTLKDYISGAPVKATPEEVEAVQVFSRRLVEELGYPKANIKTRPQHSVRSTPSGKSG